VVGVEEVSAPTPYRVVVAVVVPVGTIVVPLLMQIEYTVPQATLAGIRLLRVTEVATGFSLPPAGAAAAVLPRLVPMLARRPRASAVMESPTSTRTAPPSITAAGAAAERTVALLLVVRVVLVAGVTASPTRHLRQSIRHLAPSTQAVAVVGVKILHPLGVVGS
jgi:hypothetical protein